MSSSNLKGNICTNWVFLLLLPLQFLELLLPSSMQKLLPQLLSAENNTEKGCVLCWGEWIPYVLALKLHMCSQYSPVLSGYSLSALSETLELRHEYQEVEIENYLSNTLWHTRYSATYMWLTLQISVSLPKISWYACLLLWAIQFGSKQDVMLCC